MAETGPVAVNCASCLLLGVFLSVDLLLGFFSSFLFSDEHIAIIGVDHIHAEMA